MCANSTQDRLFRSLCGLFPQESVKSEWRAFAGAEDTFRERGTYAPRLDIAVGPFNTTFQDRRADSERIRAFDHPLIDIIGKWARERDRPLTTNPNPRCLLAIEIEESTSSKHILGGITNVSMLGRIGVVISSEVKFPKVERIVSYATKLRQVEKAPESLFGNVVCLTSDEFFELLERAQPKPPPA